MRSGRGRFISEAVRGKASILKEASGGRAWVVPKILDQNLSGAGIHVHCVCMHVPFLLCFLLLARVIILRCSRRTGSLSGVVRSVPDSTQATTHSHPHLHPGPHCVDGSLSQSSACTLTSPMNWRLRSKCKMCLVLSVACVSGTENGAPTHHPSPITDQR